MDSCLWENSLSGIWNNVKCFISSVFSFWLRPLSRLPFVSQADHASLPTNDPMTRGFRQIQKASGKSDGLIVDTWMIHGRRCPSDPLFPRIEKDSDYWIEVNTGDLFLHSRCSSWEKEKSQVSLPLIISFATKPELTAKKWVILDNNQSGVRCWLRLAGRWRRCWSFICSGGGSCRWLLVGLFDSFLIFERVRLSVVEQSHCTWGNCSSIWDVQ